MNASKQNNWYFYPQHLSQLSPCTLDFLHRVWRGSKFKFPSNLLTHLCWTSICALGCLIVIDFASTSQLTFDGLSRKVLRSPEESSLMYITQYILSKLMRNLYKIQNSIVIQRITFKLTLSICIILRRFYHYQIPQIWTTRRLNLKY